MKPRIEKKLSKKLVEIFSGTKQFDGVWTDNEYCRWPIRPEIGESLTPGEIRKNREARASVTDIPSIGGEPDYWGEGSDYHTVYERYVRDMGNLIWYAQELFRLTHRWPDDPPLTVADEARKAFLLKDAARRTRRICKGSILLPLARVDALHTRHKEEYLQMRMDASRARWEAEKAAQMPSGEAVAQ